MSRTLNDKQKYALREEHIYEGAKLLCVYAASERSPAVGEIYTLGICLGFNSTCNDTYTMADRKGNIFANFPMSDWINCNFANEEDTWIEFIYANLFTEEELFAMKLGGIESVLDLSLQQGSQHDI